MINYIKGDLFSARGILAHACNCHGVWGGGVALAFKRSFPHAYKIYNSHCANLTPQQLLGTCLLIPDHSDCVVACLFTSNGSTQSEIVNYTRLAIKDLIRQTSDPVNMPQINAGIFAVPWEKTEAVLNEFPDTDFTVYCL